MSFSLPQVKYDPTNPHPAATHALTGIAPRLQVVSAVDEFQGVLERYYIHPLKATHVPARALESKALKSWIESGFVQLTSL